MSGDRLREAARDVRTALGLADSTARSGEATTGRYVEVMTRGFEALRTLEALAADERDGGEGLDVERLARAVDAPHIFEDPLEPEAALDLAREIAAEYARLAAAQPASHICGGCAGIHPLHNQHDCVRCTCEWQMGRQPASHAADGERRELPTAEWARLRAIDDIVRELVDGWDNGFPMEDDHSATDVIERLRPFLTEPQEPHVAESGEPRP